MKTPAYTPPPKLCLTILYRAPGTFVVCLECRTDEHDHKKHLYRSATPREAAYAQRLFLSDPGAVPCAKDVE